MGTKQMSNRTYNGPVVKVYQLENGYEIASRKMQPFREGDRSPDAVKIVAFDQIQAIYASRACVITTGKNSAGPRTFSS